MRSGFASLLVQATAAAALAQVIPDVRSAIARNDFAAAEKHIADYRAQRGTTPEMLEAYSWLGRGALAAGKLDEAERYAAETRRMALAELTKRPLDAERHLPIALGASIEVHGHVLARRNARSEALTFLDDELKRWRNTSIRTRIQKNIHLLSLKGQPAPRLEMDRWLGARPSPQTDWKGRPTLLFFWAHWCGDCKRQVPVLASIQKEFGSRLRLVAPTQRYGFVARGQEAGPEEELKYIDAIRKETYGALDLTVPVSEENFRNYGASTTPTLLLLDRQGKVALYHPGFMGYEDLAARLGEVMEHSAQTAN
jgi:thiol-disulfide isomerase/thioredoxin